MRSPHRRTLPTGSPACSRHDSRRRSCCCRRRTPPRPRRPRCRTCQGRRTRIRNRRDKPHRRYRRTARCRWRRRPRRSAEPRRRSALMPPSTSPATRTASSFTAQPPRASALSKAVANLSPALARHVTSTGALCFSAFAKHWRRERDLFPAALSLLAAHAREASSAPRGMAATTSATCSSMRASTSRTSPLDPQPALGFRSRERRSELFRRLVEARAVYDRIDTSGLRLTVELDRRILAGRRELGCRAGRRRRRRRRQGTHERECTEARDAPLPSENGRGALSAVVRPSRHRQILRAPRIARPTTADERNSSDHPPVGVAVNSTRCLRRPHRRPLRGTRRPSRP